MNLRFLSPVVVVAAVLFTCTFARAQSAANGEFTVQKFHPAPGPRIFLTVEGARTEGQMAFSLGLIANYASDPFVVKSCRSNTDCSAANATQPRDIHVIDSLFTADLLASLTVIPRLQLGLRVPFTYVHGDGINTDLSNRAGAGQQLVGGLKASGLGDPMLEAKMRAVGAPTDPYVIGEPHS